MDNNIKSVLKSTAIATAFTFGFLYLVKGIVEA